jgi:uncharacterized membrane protein
MIPFAATYVTTDPAWPWSLPGVGVTALVGVALGLAALTVLTYLGVAKATPRRVAIVLVLRLLALTVALIVVLRPSLARDEDDASLVSKLIVVIDVSESMNTPDEFDHLSRYEHVKRLLSATPVADLLKRLSAERKIEMVYYMGADDLRRLDFPVKPAGKRTDIGGWLDEIWQRHGQEPNLRGLVLLTDGADNGTRFAALDKAALFRGKCKIFPFGVGRTDTTTSSKDIAVDKVWVEPAPVRAKLPMTIKAALATPGYEEAVVNVSLWIEDETGKAMKQIGPKQNIDLRRHPDKIVSFKTDAPDKQGELKVTVKVDPFPGEVNLANNEASTFVNVSKEGVSILWVEGKKRLEAVHAMKFALARDGRFHVSYVERPPDAKATPELEEALQFDKRRYDVIVIGDISAQRFSGGKPEIFDKIVQTVQSKGTGLLMLGGYDTFAAGGWQSSALAKLLPTRFDQAEQIETRVKVQPTPEGELFLLKLGVNPAKQKDLWEKKLEQLDGMATLGMVDGRATVYAYGNTLSPERKFPILASVDSGQGRVMVFGGDTTHLAWRRSSEAQAAYELFWTQLILWLAKQEYSKGALTILPDTRRLDLGKNDRLGFAVKFIKGSVGVQQSKFDAKIVGPNKEEFPVTILEENGAFRGYWTGPPMAGEYRIVVTGEGVDDKKEAVAGKDVARFMVYDEDLENTRPAADHELLQKIAAASGGKFSTALESEVVKFLENLPALQDAGRSTASRWPDWRRNPASDGVSDQATALWQSSALPCFLAFATLLCLEWFLRRRWGMV